MNINSKELYIRISIKNDKIKNDFIKMMGKKRI